eukprot:39318-Prorocentrum_minimum.AAC.1
MAGGFLRENNFGGKLKKSEYGVEAAGAHAADERECTANVRVRSAHRPLLVAAGGVRLHSGRPLRAPLLPRHRAE